jgi:hypothetical protein
MYNRNVFTNYYLKKVFISRFALVGGFDYTSTSSAQAQANPLGITSVNA